MFEFRNFRYNNVSKFEIEFLLFLANEFGLKETILFRTKILSSETFQLDLVIYHLHIDKIRQRVKLESDNSMLVDKLKQLYSAFQSIATLDHIHASFEVDGTVYGKPTTFKPIVHFDSNFANNFIKYGHMFAHIHYQNASYHTT